MKITKLKLKQIIKEELEKLSENEGLEQLTFDQLKDRADEILKTIEMAAPGTATPNAFAELETILALMKDKQAI